MKKEKQKSLCIAVCVLAAFVLWTGALLFVDVQTIGPQNTSVGFATLNRFVHNLTGVNMTLYNITDWLGLVPLGFAIGFGILGLMQWIKRKHLLRVDYSILVLGVLYIAVMAVYLFFETVVINYRPVLIDGVLEPSYPSSTTLLVMCVIPTAIMQFNSRIKRRLLRGCVAYTLTAFIIFMVTLRIISGVHWFTDIIGGAILSTGLVTMYRYASNRK